MNPSLLPLSLNKQVRNFLLSHVYLRRVDKITKHSNTAALCLTRAGYEMLLGPGYFEASEEDRCFVLLHEIAHILRGDCLTMLKRKMNGNQRMLWNVAADAGINQGLNEAAVKRLDGVWYADLVDKLELDLPLDYLPATSKIYDAILEKQEDGEGAGEAHDDLSCEEGADPDDLRRAHTRTLLDAREVLKEVEELQGHIGTLSWGLGSAQGRRCINAKSYPLPLANIILNHIVGKNIGVRMPARTFSREGRVDGLRGNALLPRIHILCAIDVSGSCSHLVEQFVGAGKWLGKRHSVQLVAFDTDLYKYTPDVPVGGGTSFQPVYRHAEALRYDAVIMLSDGCAGDAAPLPPMPVIWVVPKDHQRPPLRPRDKIIVLEDKKDAD